MWETPGRLLRVLELLQRRRLWTAAAIAAELSVSTRTVRRDVDRLRAIGYPVDAAPGIDGGYRLAPGASLPPLMFDADEAIATVLALQGAAETSAAGGQDSTLSALSKLVTVMPPRLRRQVHALTSHVTHLSFGATVGHPPAPVDLEMLTDAAVACRERLAVDARYRSRDGVESDRLLEPRQVVRAGPGWYLVAWDVARRDWRTFRLDRFLTLRTTTRLVVDRPPPDGGYDAYLAAQIAAGTQQVTAAVLVHAPRATVQHWIDPAWARIDSCDENTCVLHIGADSFDGMARWLLLLDADLTILEPPDLVHAFAKLASRAQRAASSQQPAT